MDYVEYLKSQIKRLHLIETYETKANSSHNEKTKNYYYEGMNILFQQGETMENYKQILSEYMEALKNKQQMIEQLYNEIKIIKKLRI